MGDPRRFDLFATEIAKRFPDQKLNVVDVAGGKGYLLMSLYQRGYRNVTTWDKRHKNAKDRPGYRYGYFDCCNAPPDYDLVVGMHPDQGTDHIIMYAVKHRVPFLVCPCCVMPSAAEYGGRQSNYTDWMRHLVGVAKRGRMRVEVFPLRMTGRQQVIFGWP
jgi:hypothetical protein